MNSDELNECPRCGELRKYFINKICIICWVADKQSKKPRGTIVNERTKYHK